MAAPFLAADPLGPSNALHLAYHWHLHQPIYWPGNRSGTNRYQFAADSISLKLNNAGNYYPGSTYEHSLNLLTQDSGGESARSGVGGGMMEGSLDLVGAFGSMPATLFVAAAAYQTANGGILGAQAPSGNSDGNIDSTEFLQVPTGAMLDSKANGIFDRLDPTRGFKVIDVQEGPTGFQLTWPVVPGRQYRVESNPGLNPLGWAPLPGANPVATSS